MTNSIAEQYASRLETTRRILAEDPIMVELLDPAIDPVVLERYLIQFSALGVQMTRPVDGWIRRAGERCIALGLNDIGQTLVKHSKHESGHHLMLMEDTRILVKRWNQRGLGKLDAEELISAPPTPAIAAYVALHEDTISGDTPYGQVAIELEIERMSTVVGPRQIALCKSVLGPEIIGGLSFIEEHVALDVGHTLLNQKMLERLLLLRPNEVDRLADIGAAALRAYVQFFGECLGIARTEAAARKAERISA
jgi:hypothetical protein